jgi:aminopeptidase N
MMNPKKIFLKDYQAPTFEILSTELFFDIQEDLCRVRQISKYRTLRAEQELFLDGEELQLEDIKVNGQSLTKEAYSLVSEGLKIHQVPSEFTLEIATRLEPSKNTSLEGLYAADNGKILCTQCEAQGFRRITYFMDRPDVMTNYLVHIQADPRRFPVLLSNGDLIAKKSLPDGRYEVSWRDPHKKPCYLFALVAGDLGVVKDHFITQSGRRISLEIFSAHGTQDRCAHAMQSLKKSMAWDEKRFGREYDLSTYMIVATDDFNAGAMENKGLNIFNSRLVFANSKTASDSDYYNIESVIAHEYFHNWTGNRVTLRDWFHLSLKEGLTVFRDQEFSMDMSSREMVRIENVADLRSDQFAEDAGPNAHPIRPEFCYAVDNFFTSTIYEKGSEVIRMMQTMVGRPGFRKGMDLYFDRFDGKAVIIEDFAQAIADANTNVKSQSWDQFKLWYSQAGTPKVKVSESFSAKDRTYTLHLEQSCEPTPDQPVKSPFHIPLVIGLLDDNGQEVSIRHPDITANSEGQMILHLKNSEEIFTFTGLNSRPHLSLNRQFSAPIHLDFEQSLADRVFLLENDTDSFNRWESAQALEILQFHELLKDPKHAVSKPLLEALRKLSVRSELPEDFRAALLTLPDDSYLSQLIETLDGPLLFRARQSFELQIATALETELLDLYQQWHGKNIESKEPVDFGRRRLKNTALAYLAQIEKHLPLVSKQYETATIMTDETVGFSILVDQAETLRNAAIERFHDRWKSESLVMNKWFTVQALSHSTETFETVVRLMDHPQFNIKNPNRVYSLLSRFGENLVRFHDPAQPTYSFMADRILELDKINPQVATRVVGCFDVWKKLTEMQKKKAHSELERLVRGGLSKNTYEIVSKQLAD